MEKGMERVEGVAKQLVPLFYLLGLIIGTAYYFTDGAGNLGKFLFYVGGCLAVATELHSFLLQRRILVAWNNKRKAMTAPEEEEANRDLWMYGAWLTVLLSFQVFTSIMYRAASWHPDTTFLPAGVQIIISGAVIPLFFFGVSFLSNVVTDPKDVQEETQRTTAMQSALAGQWVALRALKAARKSFEYRLKAAEKSHADLTGLAVSMQRRFADDDGAQTLMAIDSELREVEGQGPRKYAGVWVDPDAQAKAQRIATPPVVSPVAPALPDLTRMSNAELNAYAQDIEARSHDPARQGPHFLAEMHLLGAELLRRAPDRAADIQPSLDKVAQYEAQRDGRREPGWAVPLPADDIPPPPVTRFGPEQRAAWEAALGQGDGNIEHV